MLRGLQAQAQTMTATTAVLTEGPQRSRRAGCHRSMKHLQDEQGGYLQKYKKIKQIEKSKTRKATGAGRPFSKNRHRQGNY
jgi:hypothetical protein